MISRKRLNAIAVICFFSQMSFGQINIKIEADKTYFTEGKDSILSYQIAPKSINGKYSRSNYIHPLYTLDGAVLTEDFPADHLHHRGIFWSWHQLYIDDKRIGDAWEIENFKWEVTSVKEKKQKDNSKAIQAKVLWKSPLWKDKRGIEKAFVKETTTIKVHPKQQKYRCIDIEIALLALEPNMKIGGSEDEKGYGGFSPRIKLSDDVLFTSSNGKITPTNLPIPASEWMDISGSLINKEQKTGMTILCNPKNPGFPNPWILRAKKSMQNAVFPYPGAKAIPLSNKKPLVLSYRLVIHDGDANEIPIKEIYKDYAKN
ncbi:DUF6807 family protein [Flavobacterium seoulense]|uniref:Methane oxygenase PmoA n=1 Tax=Flavobacterium seoulense TaxID=1492738 RepID=A0A066WN34_9FLAO|nr:DUF6807 family protein [Flavobacterium seoulense]KDN54013.1 hypothetical protein FEM21_28300 [Flavobacterium seoulense]